MIRRKNKAEGAKSEKGPESRSWGTRNSGAKTEHSISRNIYFWGSLKGFSFSLFFY